MKEHRKIKPWFQFLIFILLMFLFEPNIFVKYSLLNNIFIGGTVCGFVLIILLLICNECKISKSVFLLILWRIVAMISTIVVSGDVLKCGYHSIIYITLFLFIEYFKSKNLLNEFFSILLKLFFTYMIINLITYIKYPNGMYDTGTHTTLYFLGVRTRFTEYALATILLSIINFYNKKISRIKLVTIVLISCLNIFLPKVSTGVVGLILIPICYCIFNKFYGKRRNVNFRFLTLIALAFTIAIVFFRVQNLFSFLIENVLQKDLTLTNRTLIWDNAFSYILKGNLFIGNGYVNDGNFISYGIRIWQAHNQFLQSIYETGIIGTIIFYGYIRECFSKVNREVTKLDLILVSFLFSFLIMMITEIYAYYLPFYVIAMCCQFKNEIVNAGEKNEK